MNVNDPLPRVEPCPHVIERPDLTARQLVLFYRRIDAKEKQEITNAK